MLKLPPHSAAAELWPFTFTTDYPQQSCCSLSLSHTHTHTQVRQNPAKFSFTTAAAQPCSAAVAFTTACSLLRLTCKLQPVFATPQHTNSQHSIAIACQFLLHHSTHARNSSRNLLHNCSSGEYHLHVIALLYSRIGPNNQSMGHQNRTVCPHPLY